MEGTRDEGDWVLVREGEVVATGGFLTHYNEPFADLYMAVPRTSSEKRVRDPDRPRGQAGLSRGGAHSRGTLQRGQSRLQGHAVEGPAWPSQGTCLPGAASAG